MKPWNILVDWSGRFVLSDFGIAVVLNDKWIQPSASPCGVRPLPTLFRTVAAFALILRFALQTPGYRAPEVEQGIPYDERIDISSLGRTMITAIWQDYTKFIMNARCAYVLVYLDILSYID